MRVGALNADQIDRVRYSLTRQPSGYTAGMGINDLNDAPQGGAPKWMFGVIGPLAAACLRRNQICIKRDRWRRI
jgi:hypothetical protein